MSNIKRRRPRWPQREESKRRTLKQMLFFNTDRAVGSEISSMCGSGGKLCCLIWKTCWKLNLDVALLFSQTTFSLSFYQLVCLHQCCRSTWTHSGLGACQKGVTAVHKVQPPYKRNWADKETSIWLRATQEIPWTCCWICYWSLNAI